MNLLEDLKIVMVDYYEGFVHFLPKLAMGLIATIILYMVLNTVGRKISKYVVTHTDDKLLGNFLKRIIFLTKAVVVFLFFLYTIGQGGIATTIFGAATISSVVIGFAFKDIAENFLAGVILAFNRPFRIGDVISTGSVEGTITGMSLRETHVKTYDGKDVYVPNGQIIKNPLYNFTIDGFLRRNFTIGVDYNSDLENVQKLILDVLQTIPGILIEDKLPKVIIKNLGASAVNIEVQFWVNTFDKKYSAIDIQNQAMRSVLEKLEQHNIGMPGDILELKNYNKESFVTS